MFQFLIFAVEADPNCVSLRLTQFFRDQFVESAESVQKSNHWETAGYKSIT